MSDDNARRFTERDRWLAGLWSQYALKARVGDRVTIPEGRSSQGLPERSGAIEIIEDRSGGCLVRHDDGHLYGWSWRELRPLNDDWKKR